MRRWLTLIETRAETLAPMRPDAQAARMVEAAPVIMNVRSPDDINANAKVDLGVLYRGVEAGPDATQALRPFKGGDLGDGIYLTAWQGLAASYGGGAKASVRAGTRVVHAYRVTPLFPEDVVYLFGGMSVREPVRLVSGNGIGLWEGPWESNQIETALRQHGGIKVVIGTPRSIGINQVAVRDRTILKPETMPRLTEAARKRYLYHFTDADNLPDIFQNGVRPLSYWGTMQIAMWYRSSLYRGDRPVILRVPFTNFDPNYLEPDMRGLQDPPPSSITEMTDEEVSDAWDTIENPNWEDCLNLIGSVSYRGIIRITKQNIFSTTDANGRRR